jgi:hypothetical protein
MKYPGLYLAMTARRANYRERQVIVYSVHRLEEIERECRQIGCTYIAKGRPSIFKQELLDVLSFDPTRDVKQITKSPRPSQLAAPTKKSPGRATKKAKGAKKR